MSEVLPATDASGPDLRARTDETWQLLLGIGRATVRNPEPVAPSQTVPFTLVCGFLGAGKTTLVNHLLSRPGGRRIAVVVNDFGSVGIDAALIRRRSATAIDLANGCICCSLSGGLANTLADLLGRPEPPDAVVVEASGVAEPLGIVHVALANRAMHLAGIVTLADAETLCASLGNPEIARTVARQIESADIVLLNKADLASPDERAAVQAAIGSLNPAARVIDTVRSDVPADVVLGLGPRSAFSAEAEPAIHRNPFRNWRFASDVPLDDRRLCAVMADLPPAIVRAKGFVHAASEPSRRFVAQAVGRRWTFERDEPWQEPPRTEIVLIGFGREMEAGPATLSRLALCERDHTESDHERRARHG